jgi:hypothetical protein
VEGSFNRQRELFDSMTHDPDLKDENNEEKERWREREETSTMSQQSFKSIETN